MAKRPVSDLYSMGKTTNYQSLYSPVTNPINGIEAPLNTFVPEVVEKIVDSRKSKRQRQVDSIGYSMPHLDQSFRSVFKNISRTTKHGNEPVSNLNVLRLSDVELEEKDDKAVLVIAGNVKNTWKLANKKPTNKQGYSPEIALYRTSVQSPWDFNMKGKVFCDCEAFNYHLAHPLHVNKNFRGNTTYAAKTYADPGPNRIRNPGMQVALCKHLVKLWHYVKQRGINNLLKK